MVRPVPLIMQLALLCGLVQAGDPPRYAVEFLGPGTSGAALNEAGTAVGWITTAGITRAAISLDGEPMQPLPLPAGYVSSMALDINDLGLVVGTVSPTSTANLQPHAAAWRPSPGGYVVEVLGEPAGSQYSAATGVNNLGDIVGSSGTTPWFYWIAAVHFTASGPVVLPGLDAAEDVNDHRKVLSGNRLLDLDTMSIETIPLPAGSWNGFVGHALNELDGTAGKLIGWSSTCGAFPMRYLPAVGWTYVGGCGQNTGASALNDLGDCLTWAGTWAHGVVFEGLGYFGFAGLIDPSQGAWLTGSGGDINNARQILVGVTEPGTNASGVARLTPLDPVPPAWIDLGGGTSGVHGSPDLTLTGPLTPGSTLMLDLVDGPPGALAVLFVSFASAPASFLGGTLHAFPVDELLVLGTDAGGGLHGAATFPGAPSGQGLWFQLGVADASVALYGATLSNGMQGTVP